MTNRERAEALAIKLEYLHEDFACSSIAMDAMERAIAAARADGFAEAIEKAAKVVDAEIERALMMVEKRNQQGLETHGWSCRHVSAVEMSDAIRALAPAGKETK